MDLIVVTGAGGFLGEHLCTILGKFYSVIGVDVRYVKPIDNIKWVSIERGTDLSKIVAEIQPSVIVHAAFTNRKPKGNSDCDYINDMMAVNVPLFKTIKEIQSKLLLISSSAVYSNTSKIETIDESYSLGPVSLYGFTKMIQEKAAQYYLRQNVCTLRLFNLCGPGQKKGMLLPDWVNMALDIVQGKKEVMNVKHRKTSRDFVDVRDVSRAIYMVLEKFDGGEIFNIASNEKVSLVEISNELEKLAGQQLNIVESDIDVQLEDVNTQKGSYSKILSSHGWKPTYSWRESLNDLWDSYK